MALLRGLAWGFAMAVVALVVEHLLGPDIRGGLSPFALVLLTIGVSDVASPERGAPISATWRRWVALYAVLISALGLSIAGVAATFGWIRGTFWAALLAAAAAIVVPPIMHLRKRDISVEKRAV
jgi:hypothetical protein